MPNLYDFLFSVALKKRYFCPYNESQCCGPALFEQQHSSKYLKIRVSKLPHNFHFWVSYLFKEPK